MYVVASDEDAGGNSAAESFNCFRFKDPSCPMCVPQTTVAVVVCIPSFVICALLAGLSKIGCNDDLEDRKRRGELPWYYDPMHYGRSVGNCCSE